LRDYLRETSLFLASSTSAIPGSASFQSSNRQISLTRPEIQKAHPLDG